VLVYSPDSFSHADVGGIGVHIAARLRAATGPGEILVSGTVHDLVTGSGNRPAGPGNPPAEGRPRRLAAAGVTAL
jgi:class 3 adenylate cyclase